MKKSNKLIAIFLVLSFFISILPIPGVPVVAHNLIDPNNKTNLFTDDFSGELNSDWKKEYQNYTYNGVTAASVSNGALNFNNNGFFYSYANAAAYNWSDYTVESDINVTPWAGNGTNHGIAGRVNSDGTGYRFFYSGLENDFILMYATKDGIYGHRWWMTGGTSLSRTENTLLSTADPNNLGVHKFKIEFEGTLIKCYVDNTVIITYNETDATRNTKGTIGLYTFNHTHNGWFDNIKVYSFPSSVHYDDFSDDFSGTFNTKWTKGYQTYSNNGSTAASIVEGKLSFNGNGLFYYYNDTTAYNWSDYVVTSDINVTPWGGNGSNHGIAGRVNNQGTGYRFFYSALQNDFVLMYASADGYYGHEWGYINGGTALSRVGNTIISNADQNNLGVHQFKMEFTGDTIKCYVDNTLIITYKETDVSRNTKGTIGLYIYNLTQNGWFDNVHVYRYPYFESASDGAHKTTNVGFGFYNLSPSDPDYDNALRSDFVNTIILSGYSVTDCITQLKKAQKNNVNAFVDVLSIIWAATGGTYTVEGTTYNDYGFCNDWQNKLKDFVQKIKDAGVDDTFAGFYTDEPFAYKQGGISADEFKTLTQFNHDTFGKRFFAMFALVQADRTVYNPTALQYTPYATQDNSQYLTDLGFSHYYDFAGDLDNQGIPGKKYREILANFKSRLGTAASTAKIWHVPSAAWNSGFASDSSKMEGNFTGLYDLLKQETNPGGLMCYNWDPLPSSNDYNYDIAGKTVYEQTFKNTLSGQELTNLNTLKAGNFFTAYAKLRNIGREISGGVFSKTIATPTKNVNTNKANFATFNFNDTATLSNATAQRVTSSNTFEIRFSKNDLKKSTVGFVLTDTVVINEGIGFYINASDYEQTSLGISVENSEAIKFSYAESGNYYLIDKNGVADTKTGQIILPRNFEGFIIIPKANLKSTGAIVANGMIAKVELDIRTNLGQEAILVDSFGSITNMNGFINDNSLSVTEPLSDVVYTPDYLSDTFSSSLSSNWKKEDQNLSYNGATDAHILDSAFNFSQSGFLYSYAKTEAYNWSDYTFETDINLSVDGVLTAHSNHGIAGRINSDGTGYRFFFNAVMNQFVLSYNLKNEQYYHPWNANGFLAKVDNSLITVASGQAELGVHKFKMTFEGSSIKCYVDDSLVIDYTETDASKNTKGTIGLYTYNYSRGTSFDNVKVFGTKPSTSISDNFSSTLDTRWKIENQNYSYNNGTSAVITDGKLNFQSNGFLYSFNDDNAYKWGDYTVSADVNVTPWAVNVNSSNSGIGGRINSSGTGYRFFYNGSQNRFVLSYNEKNTNYNHEWDATGYLTRVDNSLIATSNGATDLGVHNFKMVFVGVNIKCYVDNVLVINYTETDAAKNKKGTIGLYTYNHTHNTWFDNLKVSMLSGDANFDGAINIADLVILKKQLLKSDVTTQLDKLSNLDLVLDRKITISDLITMKKRILGIN